MAKTKEHSKSRVIIITLTIFVALVILACGITIAAGIYTNGFESMNSHYIKLNGALLDANKPIVYTGEPMKFSLSGAGFKSRDWGDFTVGVGANPRSEIAYKIGDKDYLLGDDDLTARFAIVKGTNEFMILDGDYRLSNVLDEKFGEHAKVMKIKPDIAPYILTVTSEDGNKVAFEFRTNEKYPGYDIEVVPPAISF